MKRLLLILAIAIQGLAFAQQQVINVGSAPNDHSGDNLRGAFIKVNANDTELYANVLPSSIASGTDTYSTTPDPAITYTTGKKLIVTFTNGNTGASTINANGLGAKSLKKNVSEDLEVGDILPGQAYLIIYDGTNFQIIGGGGGGLEDGDYGDIDIGDDGTTMTIDTNAVTNIKINDVALGKITGLGTGVATALAVNVGSAGSPLVNGGVLGTPSSGTATNLTGLPISTGVSGLGTGVATALGVNVGSSGAVVVNGGALGTPSSGVATNLTGTASGLSIGGNAATATTMASGSIYTLDRATPSTAGGTITLDMNSQKQRVHVGSASFSTPKTIALSNTTNSLVFSFSFTVTNVAAVLTMPSDFVMFSIDWDGTDWTPPATGLYEMGGSFDGTNWIVKIAGPFN